MLALVLTVLLVCISPPASAQSTTGSIRLDAAEWVPRPDPTYGWWSAVPSGAAVEGHPRSSDLSAVMAVEAGSYDVYWKQSLEHTPFRIAAGVQVAGGSTAVVTLRDGLRLDVADWVQLPERTYGWWGAAPAGSDASARVHWRPDAGALVLPAGAYDVYWKQDIEHQPFLLAEAVQVSGLTPLVIAEGVRLVTADWVPPPERTYGWWGLAPTGAGAAARVHWSHAPGALVAPAGAYDVYWKQDLEHDPSLLARDVTVARGSLSTVVADAGIRLSTPVPFDDGYGWWGATASGAAPEERVQWSRNASTPLLLPPGRYDVWTARGLGVEPHRIGEAVDVTAGTLRIIEPASLGGEGEGPDVPGGGDGASTDGGDPGASDDPTPPTSFGTRTLGAALDADARGTDVTFVIDGATPNGTLVAVARNGSEFTIGPAANASGWTAPGGGFWRIELREPTPEGGMLVVAQDSIFVLPPIAPVEEAVLVVGSGAAVVLVLSRGLDWLDFLRRLLTQAGSDRARERTKDVAPIERWVRLGSGTAALLAIALMAFFVGFAEADPRGTIPGPRAFATAALAVLLFEAVLAASELILSRGETKRPPYRLWTAGTVSVALTSLVFRVPVGYTGYVERPREGASPREKRRLALTSLAVVGSALVSVGVFLLTARFVSFTLGNVGMTMALASLAVIAMPLKLLPGHAIWSWSRAAGAGVAVLMLALHAAFVAGLASATLLGAASLMGLCAFVLAMFWGGAEKEAAELTEKTLEAVPRA